MILVKEHASLPRLLVFPFLVLAMAAMVILQKWPQVVLGLAHCPLRNITGLPCPTCGGTNAAVDLANGYWVSSLVNNPLVFFSAVTLGLWAIYAVIATAIPTLRRSVQLGPHEKRATRILVALLIISTWIWEIIRL